MYIFPAAVDSLDPQKTGKTPYYQFPVTPKPMTQKNCETLNT